MPSPCSRPRSGAKASGRSVRGTRGRGSRMRRVKWAFRRPFWRSIPRRRRRSTACASSARGACVHPFDDHNFVAGNATLGMEILEDLPNVKTVIAAIGGGGLISGIGSAIRQLAPKVRILGAEPETAAPGALSFEKQSPQVFSDWEASFVDGAGGKSIFPRMWERMQGIVDGSIVVSLDEVRRAMRLVAEKTRVIAEGAGALAVAAALSGRAGEGPIVAVVSGGNVDLKKFAELVL